MEIQKSKSRTVTLKDLIDGTELKFTAKGGHSVEFLVGTVMNHYDYIIERLIIVEKSSVKSVVAPNFEHNSHNWYFPVL